MYTLDKNKSENYDLLLNSSAYKMFSGYLPNLPLIKFNNSDKTADMLISWIDDVMSEIKLNNFETSFSVIISDDAVIIKNLIDGKLFDKLNADKDFILTKVNYVFDNETLVNKILSLYDFLNREFKVIKDNIVYENNVDDSFEHYDESKNKTTLEIEINEFFSSKEEVYAANLNSVVIVPYVLTKYFEQIKEIFRTYDYLSKLKCNEYKNHLISELYDEGVSIEREYLEAKKRDNRKKVDYSNEIVQFLDMKYTLKSKYKDIKKKIDKCYNEAVCSLDNMHEDGVIDIDPNTGDEIICDIDKIKADLKKFKNDLEKPLKKLKKLSKVISEDIKEILKKEGYVTEKDKRSWEDITIGELIESIFKL